MRGRFPPDASGMTIDDRKALQGRLASRGYDVGAPDGVIGQRTKDAIAAREL